MGVLLAGCGGGAATPRPQQSLVTLDFSPLPTLAPLPSPNRTPFVSHLPASWPVGWDTAFCTAFSDLTVAHELVIDIERALADNNRSDAQGLADELNQTAPIATREINGLKDWEPAATAKTDLAGMLDLDTQAAQAYHDYFHNHVNTALRDARQLRNQVSKQVGPANQQLSQIAATGLSCPGHDLKLESF